MNAILDPLSEALSKLSFLSIAPHILVIYRPGCAANIQVPEHRQGQTTCCLCFPVPGKPGYSYHTDLLFCVGFGGAVVRDVFFPEYIPELCLCEKVSRFQDRSVRRLQTLYSIEHKISCSQHPPFILQINTNSCKCMTMQGKSLTFLIVR